MDPGLSQSVTPAAQGPQPQPSEGALERSDSLAAIQEERLAEARAAAEAGELPRAERLYRELLAGGCRDLRLFSNLGALALLRDQPDIALGWLEQGLALDPGHAGCLLNAGMALHKLQRTHEAIKALRGALAAEPTLAKAWNNLAVVLIDSCRRDRMPGGRTTSRGEPHG